MMTLDAGVDVYAGMPIIIYQIGPDTYELHRAQPDLVDTLVIRTDLINENHIYQIAMFCAGLVDSWDIAD
jgi:hypothetical protein